MRFPCEWEVVRARGLHQLKPDLWAVTLVDENGHGKELRLNRRGDELYDANPIAADVLICQERFRTDGETETGILATRYFPPPLSTSYVEPPS